jgi:hypothetical protein
MRGVLQDDPPGEFVLKVLAISLQCRDRLLFLPLGTDRADEDMRVLEIGRDVDGTHGNKGSLELHFTSDDHPKLALDQFTDSDGS